MQPSGVFDTVIVGGGTAGCVLASRLSADPARRVLLIEAGPDVPPDAIPDDIRASNAASALNPAYRWPLAASHGNGDSGAGREVVHQARVLGGGSSLMGMIALRGVPQDYEDWVRAGAQGWGWDDVLPYFRAVERDLNFTGPLHGSDGPTAIRRQPTDSWPPLSRATAAWAGRMGWPAIEDMNGDFRDGVSALPMSSLPGLRQSSSICYLDAQVRRRANLKVLARARVVALGRQGTRFESVSVRLDDGSIKRFATAETVLCAGALLTPALLLHAGVGDAAQLSRHGIGVAVHRPGVGRNLLNHPLLLLASLLPRAARQHDCGSSSLNACLRYASEPGSSTPDLYINPSNRAAAHPLGRRMATLQSYLFKPRSTGKVELASADPMDAPRVAFNFLSDDRDLQRTRRLWTDMARLATSEEVAALGTRFHAIRFSARMRRLNAGGPWNHGLSRAAAFAYDWLPGAGAFIGKAMPYGPSAAEVLQMDAVALDQLSHQYISSSGHHAGTCRMGAEGDPQAVVNPHGKVHGVQGLRVADASVMPGIPCGNTNLPTLMLAEKMASHICAG